MDYAVNLRISVCSRRACLEILYCCLTSLWRHKFRASGLIVNTKSGGNRRGRLPISWIIIPLLLGIYKRKNGPELFWFTQSNPGSGSVAEPFSDNALNQEAGEQNSNDTNAMECKTLPLQWHVHPMARLSLGQFCGPGQN